MAEISIAEAHDRLLKLLLEEPGVAESLLRERLPKALVVQFVEGGLERVPATYVDEQLHERRADRRFRLQLRSGEVAWFQCLLEHKSTLASRLEVQLLGYVSDSYTQLVRELDRKEKLPLIVVLVVYNGRAPWKKPMRFSDMLGIDDELRPLALDFPIHVFDLGRSAPRLLSRNPHLRGGLKLLRFALRFPPGDPVEPLVSLLEDLRGMSDTFLLAATQYMRQYFQARRREELHMAFRKVMPEKEHRLLATLAEEDRAEARAEGRAEALAASLLKLLERRLGPVPESIADRVHRAAPAELDTWFDRSIDAQTLEQVFGPTEDQHPQA